MDTKSKKSRPFAAWLSFFAAVSILFTLFIACVSAVVWADGDYSILKAPFQSYKNSMMFKEQTANYFEELFDRVQRMPEIGQETDVYPLDREGENVKFLAAKNQVITNMKGGLSFTMNGMPVSPVGYEYFWYFDGNKVWVVDHGQTVDTRRLDSGYRRLINPSKMFWYSDAEMSGTRVFLAVKDNLEKNPYEQSTYYWDQQMLPVIGGICVGFAVLALLLLIYAFLKRQEKRYFERRLSSWSGSLLLELKLIISVMVLTLSVRVADSGNQFDFYGWFLLIPCWWFYLMLIDLIHNRKRFFTNNLINWLFKRYRKIENMYPWQKNLLMRAYLLVAAEAILAPISVVILLNGGDGGFFVAFLIAIFGVYLIYRYLRRFNRTIQDYGKLTDQIEIMKNGDMTTRLNLNPDADMYAAAQNLNSVQEGMSIAVAERIRSERMKMELITNVSHDLKTPLTSIISYVDLLNREDNLSDQVKDYVQILAQKSDRLNNLIQDLFDLSKASSENMSLDMERLDLARLINQTMADMDERIGSSGLTFRSNIPDQPVYIVTDGKKLYRVMENLISNSLKYSLSGSRVFVDLVVNDHQATVTIKNTANYEMNFNEEEILQRFVRGDQSRTTEGSGLGLSIAQSFTEICGGHLSIKVDGDLFKVELVFSVDSTEPTA